MTSSHQQQLRMALALAICKSKPPSYSISEYIQFINAKTHDHAKFWRERYDNRLREVAALKNRIRELTAQKNIVLDLNNLVPDPEAGLHDSLALLEDGEQFDDSLKTETVNLAVRAYMELFQSDPTRTIEDFTGTFLDVLGRHVECCWSSSSSAHLHTLFVQLVLIFRMTCGFFGQCLDQHLAIKFMRVLARLCVVAPLTEKYEFAEFLCQQAIRELMTLAHTECARSTVIADAVDLYAQLLIVLNTSQSYEKNPMGSPAKLYGQNLKKLRITLDHLMLDTGIIHFQVLCSKIQWNMLDSMQ